MMKKIAVILVGLVAAGEIFADNGLSIEDRKTFYHREEGSEIIPLALLKPLYQAGTDNLFLDNLERFGLIKDTNTQTVDQLPIGITAGPTRDSRAFFGSKLKMVGVNCAACHVNSITFQGQSLIIDGAPNRFDIESFFQDLAKSVTYTLNPLNGRLIEYLKNVSLNPNNSIFSPNSQLLTRSMSISGRNPNEKKLDEDIVKLIEKVIAEEALTPPTDAETFYNDFKAVSAPATPVLKLSDEATRSLNLIDRRLRTEPFDLQGLSQTTGKRSILNVMSEMKVAIRLLKARVGFLTKLGAGGASTPGLNGRTDAFGHARVFIFQSEQNFESLAPVDYPSLWGFADRTWMHWDGNTNSVLERNFGQALGLGAVFSKTDFSSTVSLRSLHALEVLARKITSPAWPSNLLGPLNEERQARGKELFVTNCASCHFDKEPPGGFPLSALDQIKTDPNHATQFAAPLQNNGPAFADALSDVLGKLKRKAQTDEGISDADIASWEFGRVSQWRSTRAYISRPLQGIWASAPYLHNGSVPTLYDLLSPVSERPKSFQVGQREFDPVAVGYVSVAPGTINTKTLDTSIPGNSNSGHVYGPPLDHEQKLDLIEYLKSL